LRAMAIRRGTHREFAAWNPDHSFGRFSRRRALIPNRGLKLCRVAKRQDCQGAESQRDGDCERERFQVFASSSPLCYCTSSKSPGFQLLSNQGSSGPWALVMASAATINFGECVAFI